jgi:sulfite reductase (NADPH) hemoprotein beta-component
MYRYDEFDHKVVRQRIAQFRQQVERRVNGSLTEDEFKPLRLMNGLYLQLHAYMLRVAIPYGTLSSRQMHQLAYIADTFDRGFGHFTVRTLHDTPEYPVQLAEPGRDTGYSRSACRGRDARYPDLRQLHSKRDLGPARRRDRR